jgi:hypothetical protein
VLEPSKGYSIPGEILTHRPPTTPVANDRKSNFDLIIFYDLAGGLRFPFPEMRETFIELVGLKKEPPKATAGMFPPQADTGIVLPRDPAKALDMVESVLKMPDRKAPDSRVMHTLFVIDYAESLVPAGNMAQLPPSDRYCIIKLLNWAKDPVISENANPIVLIADSPVLLNKSLTSSGSRIEQLEIMLPSPEERLSYIEEMEADFLAETGKGINFEPGFTKERFAHLTAGLKKLNVEDIRMTAGIARVKIGPELIKARKRELFKSDYASVIEVIDPDKGFEVVGGMQWLKDWMRHGVIDPMLNGITKRRPMGLGFAGAGGCQPAGNKVLLADGSWKNVEDIVVGDEVVSPQSDGTVRNVRVDSVCEYEDQETFTVQTIGRREVRSYQCSWNHIIPFLGYEYGEGSHLMRRRHSVLKEDTAQEVSLSSYNKMHNYRVLTSPAVEFPQQILPVHPYVLGVLLGDATMTLRKQGTHGSVLPAALTNTARDLVKATKKYGATWGKTKNPTVCATGEFSKTVKALECFGLGSHNKFVPQAWKIGSIEQRRQLLAGLVDTDGTKEEFASASQRLATDFAELIRSIGGTATMKSRWTKCNGKSFFSYRVHYSLGESCLPLTRKWKRQHARDFEWKHNRHFGFEMIPGKKQPVYGFHLAEGSQWYVTDGWLITGGREDRD